MNFVHDPTRSKLAMQIADKLPRPDDLLARILINCTLELSIDPSGVSFVATPVNFDCLALVGICAAWLARNRRSLREVALATVEAPMRKASFAAEPSSARPNASLAQLLEDFVASAAGHYAAEQLDFVRQSAALFLSKGALLLDVLEGGRDPFEGIH